VALVGDFFWYGLRTDWRTLYADMDPEDARLAGQILSQAQIPFETGMPRNRQSRSGRAVGTKARLLTAAKGLKSGRLGFLRSSTSPTGWASEFDEQVNYQRALEGDAGAYGELALRRCLGAGPPGGCPMIRFFAMPERPREGLGW